MILTCQVFGKRAGQNAARRARDRGLPLVRAELVTAEAERLAGLRARRGSLRPARLKRQLQECMWRHVLVVRSGESLRTCLGEIARLRDQMEDMGVEGPGELVDALEVDNLFTVAEIMARAALLRTESRGSHYREDHPPRDDARWQTSIVTRQTGGHMEQYTFRLPRLAAATVG